MILPPLPFSLTAIKSGTFTRLSTMNTKPKARKEDAPAPSRKRRRTEPSEHLSLSLLDGWFGYSDEHEDDASLYPFWESDDAALTPHTQEVLTQEEEQPRQCNSNNRQ